jgi:prostaglandin-H2 D-isomerase / glutathione transferase
MSQDYIQLKYFDCRGVAETTRMLFAVSGIEYTDVRFAFDEGFKSSEFAATKAAGDLTANLDRAPVLVVGDKTIGQSKVIERFAARRGGLMGDDEFEAAMIEAIAEHVKDLKDKYMKVKAEGSVDTFFETTMPAFMELIEKVLGDTPGCAVGTKISYADVCLYMLITEFFDNKEGAAASIANCPKITAAVAAVAAHPGVVAWLAKRPETAF